MGPSRSVRISEGLPDAKKPLVLAHEAGHAIEDIAAGIDIPALEQQNWQDPPAWQWPLPKPPKERLIPRRDEW